MAKALTVSPSSGKDIGNGVTARFEFQQVKSTTAGKVDLQIRAIFSCVDYGASSDRELGAAMHVKLGESASASDIIFTQWPWTRHRGDSVTGPWINLTNINAATSLKFYIIINNGYNPSSGDVNWGTISVSGITRSWALTRTINDHVNSLYYSITDGSGLNGSNRTNQTASSAIVYDGDTYSWSASAATGYSMNTASGSGTVSSNVAIAPTAKINTYKVTISQGEHTSIIVMNGSTAVQNGSYVDYGSNLTISITASPGYKIKTRSPASNTINNVSSAVTVSATAEPMATVRIKTLSGWGMYLIHIRSGGTWKQYQARIKDSSGWGIYS